MAITTRTELLTAIDNWLSRTDLSGRAAEFVALCEADMMRRLRLVQMESSQNVTLTSTGPVTMPSGLLEIRRAYLNQTAPKKLNYISPSQAFEMGLSQDTGEPEFFTIEDEKIRAIPTPDGSYTLSILGYSALSALSTSVSTNYILTYHPDAYLFGSLKEAYTYLRDEEELAKADARYERALSLIETQDKRGRVSGPLQSRAQVVV